MVGASLFQTMFCIWGKKGLCNCCHRIFKIGYCLIYKLKKEQNSKKFTRDDKTSMFGSVKNELLYVQVASPLILEGYRDNLRYCYSVLTFKNSILGKIS